MTSNDVQLPARPLSHHPPFVPLRASSVPRDGRLPKAPVSGRHVLPRLWASDAPLLLLMPWGRLDDNLHDHPKLDKLGRDRLPGVGLWVLCISWANRHLTDGHVPAERVARLGGTLRLADKLVEVGLLDTTSDGYLVHDFLMFNPSRAQIDEDRRTARERMTVVRANKSRSSGEVQSPRTNTNTRPTSFVPKVVDEREWTEAERLEAYIASQSKRTGVS